MTEAHPSSDLQPRQKVSRSKPQLDELKQEDHPNLSESFWYKVKDSANTVFRTFGLNILSYMKPRHSIGRRTEEPIKVAIRHSRVIALSRALIHFIPVGVTFWEVLLNWNTYYVGSTALNQVYYQLGAKIHELMIQASITAISFSYIRYELSNGNGLLFGLILSGLQINQISYLWSMDLWGSMGSKHFSVRRKPVMFFALLIFFILAVSTGPSSAVLLVPRLNYCAAGSTHIWLNATFEDIWPTQLDGSSVPNRCSVTQAFTASDECPSSEWQNNQRFISIGEGSIPDNYLKLVDSNVWPSDIQLTGNASTRQFLSTSWQEVNPFPNVGTYGISTVVSTTQQSVIADALAITASLWGDATTYASLSGRHGYNPNSDQEAIHQISSGYYQPYSMVTCVVDTINGSSDSRPVAFPINTAWDYTSTPSYAENIKTSISGVPVIDYPVVRRNQMLDLPGSRCANQLEWVELPQKLFPAAAIGAIILLPQDPDSVNETDPNRDMAVCNLAAGWGSTIMNVSYFRAEIDEVSSSINYHDPDSISNYNSEYRKVNGGQAPIIDFYQIVTDTPAYYGPPQYPTIQMTINRTWAEYLNPYLLDFNTTLIDWMLEQTAAPGSICTKSVYPENAAMSLLSGLLANGLARTGFTRKMQGNIKTTTGPKGEAGVDGNAWLAGKTDMFTVDPEQSKNWIKLQVNSSIKGYAYNIHGASPKVAIVVLLTYCTLAFAHLLYSGIYGISSTTWETVAEITALAVNSVPTTLLRNTCAGISKLYIFQIPVRILASGDNEGDGQHLEMVFGSDDGSQDGDRSAIKPNRKYGTMPRAIR